MAPSEFWRLHPDEFHVLCDARTPVAMATPNMTLDEAAEIYRKTYGEV